MAYTREHRGPGSMRRAAAPPPPSPPPLRHHRHYPQTRIFPPRVCPTTLLAALFLAAYATTIFSAACGVGESTTMTVTRQPVGGTGGLPFTTQPIVTLTGLGGVVCVNDSTTTIHAMLGKNPAVFASLAKASTCSDSVHNNDQAACTAIGGNVWSAASDAASHTVVVVAGVGTFAGLYVNENATGYTLHFVASGSGLFAESSTFNVQIGPPHSVQLHRERSSGTLWAHLTSQDNADADASASFTITGSGGSPFNPPPRLSLMDAGGNLVVDDTYSTGLGAEVKIVSWPSAQKNQTTGVALAGVTRIGALTSNVTALSVASAFVSGTATFLGLQIDVAGGGYGLRFTVFNLSSAFPDVESQAYADAFCSQPVLTHLGQGNCTATNTWHAAVPDKCEDNNGNEVGSSYHTESTCASTGATWIPGTAAYCSQPLLTHLGQGNCTANNTWHPVVPQIIEGLAHVTGSPSTLIASVNLTLDVTADIGVGLPNHTRVDNFPYGAVKAGEAIYPAMRVFLEDAGGNLVAADSVSRCTVALLNSPFGGREEHPGYGVARIGTERTPPVLPHRHAFLDVAGGDQSLTVDFKDGIATFYGVNISHVGGPYALRFNASTQVDPRKTPYGWTGSVIGDTNPFFITEGAPRRLIVVRGPEADIAGREPLSPQPTIALVDAGGNIIRSEHQHYIIASLVESPSGAPLLGTTTVKLEAGVAQFTDLAIENPAHTYVIKFTSTAVYGAPRYAAADMFPLEVNITFASRYSAVKMLRHADPQPRDGFGHSLDAEPDFDSTSGIPGSGRMLLVAGAPFEDRPVPEIQTVRTRAGSNDYVREVQTITTSVLHISEVQEIKTSVAAGATIKTTVVQTGDRIDLVPRFRLRWKHASPLSNFLVYPEGDAHSSYYPKTETYSQDIPWNALPENIATVLMKDFADLGIGNIDVTRHSDDDNCQCTGAFRWLVTFRDLRGPVPLLEAVDLTMVSMGHASATVTTARVHESPSLGGHFTLSFPTIMHTGHIPPLQGPQTTRPIAHSASSDDMATILAEDLWNYTDVSVSVVGAIHVPMTHAEGASKPNVVDFSRTWTVTFGAQEMYYAVPQMLLGSAAALTGHGARVALETYVEGAAPVGGHFSLGFRGVGATGPQLRWNASAAEVKTALESLTSIYTVDVARSYSDTQGKDHGFEWTITFLRVSDETRLRKEGHLQTHLASPMWSDEQYQAYSWNSEWVTSNGNLPPLRANTTLTTGTAVAVEIGAIYDMSSQGDSKDASGTGVGRNHAVAGGKGVGPAQRLQILNNLKASVLSGTYKNYGGAVKSRARMGRFGADAGAAYVFTRTQTGGATNTQRWTQRIKLRSVDTTASDRFGWSVSSSGTAVVVGAPGADDEGLIEQKVFRCVADGGNFRLLFRNRGYAGQSVTSKEYLRTTEQGPTSRVQQTGTPSKPSTCSDGTSGGTELQCTGVTGNVYTAAKCEGGGAAANPYTADTNGTACTTDASPGNYTPPSCTNGGLASSQTDCEGPGATGHTYSPFEASKLGALNLEKQPVAGASEEEAPTTTMTKPMWAGTLTVRELATALEEAWSVGRVVLRQKFNVGGDSNTTTGARTDTTAFESQMLTDPAGTSLNDEEGYNNEAFLNKRVCNNGTSGHPLVDLVIFFHSRNEGDLPSMYADTSPMHMYPLIVNGTTEIARVDIVDLVNGTTERRGIGAAHVFRWDRRSTATLSGNADINGADPNAVDVWYEEAKLMVPRGMSQVGSQMGHQVAIQGDTIVSSAPGDGYRGPSAGAVYVFKRTRPYSAAKDNGFTSPAEALGSRRRVAQAIDAPEWEFAQRLTTQDFTCGLNSDILNAVVCPPSLKSHTGRRFGATVALLENTLVIAERPEDARWGSSLVRIYRRRIANTMFLPSQTLKDPYAFDSSKPLIMSSMFGYSVSISADTLAIGAPGRGTAGGKGAVLMYKRVSGDFNFPLKYESRIEGRAGAIEGDGFGAAVTLEIADTAKANPNTVVGNDLVVVASHPLSGMENTPPLRLRKLVQAITTNSTDGGMLGGHFYITRSVRQATISAADRDISWGANFDIIPMGEQVEVRRSGPAGVRYHKARVLVAPGQLPNRYNTGGGFRAERLNLDTQRVIGDTYTVRYLESGRVETQVRRQRMRAVRAFKKPTNQQSRADAWWTVHTRRLSHDISAANLAKALSEDLGMHRAHIERWGPDTKTGGFTWVITHQSEYGDTPTLLDARSSGALFSSVTGIDTVGTSRTYGRALGGVTIKVQTLNKPQHLQRRSLSVFFRDRAHMAADNTDARGQHWIEHGVMRPVSEDGRLDPRGTELMAANNVGVNCMSYHHGMVAVGAPNRDSYRSGNNAGAAYVFDMAYFNLGFGNAAYGYNVSEDGGTISIPIDRCGTLDGGTRCRIPMVRNSLDPKAVLQYAEYVVGDGPGSRVPGAIGGIGGAGAGVGGVGDLSDVPLLPFPVEDYAVAATQAGVSCPNPTGQGCASTATGRADCHARSRYGKAKYECQWLPGDSKMTQVSSFDFSATSDYSPDWRTFSMLATEASVGDKLNVRHTFDVVITNDDTREFPDERFNLRLIVPGIEPSWSGDLWTTVRIYDDGDGGVGVQSFYEILAAVEPEPPLRGEVASGLSNPRCVGSPASYIITSHVNSTHVTAAHPGSASCNAATSRTLCQEIPGCFWLAGPTAGALNETNAGSTLNNQKATSDVEDMPGSFVPGPTNASRVNFFGSVVKIDRVRGDLAVVSAPLASLGAHTECGAVYVYQKRSTHGVWERVAVLVAPDPWYRSGTRFGRSLALSNGTLVVGADHHYPDIGGTAAQATASHRAYVFELDDATDASARAGSLWTHAGNLTWPLDHAFSDASGTRFGYRHGVAVSNDWIAVSAPGDEAVFLFRRGMPGGSGALWQPSQRLRRTNHFEVFVDGRDLNPTALRTMHARFLSHADFGASVALWNDTLVVGVPDDDFELTSDIDGPVTGHTTMGTGSAGGGPTMEGGHHAQGTNVRGRGSVYVYVLEYAKAKTFSNESWKLQTTLRAPDAAAMDRFGEAVDVNWDFIVVGAPGDSMKSRASWGFETGDLTGWHSTGTAFDWQPTLGDNTRARNVYGHNMSMGTDIIETEEMRTPEHKSTRRDYVNQYAFVGDKPQDSGMYGRYWIGTYENRSHVRGGLGGDRSADPFDFSAASSHNAMGTVQGDGPRGTLTSDPFLLGGQEMSFLVGGGCDPNRVRVELLVDGEEFVFPHVGPPAPEAIAGNPPHEGMPTATVLTATGSCSETMTRVRWDVTPWQGRVAQIRIVDASSASPWGHINFDDVRFHGQGWRGDATGDSKGHTAGGETRTEGGDHVNMDDASAAWTSNGGNTTCDQGQCGFQFGRAAGSAYLFKRYAPLAQQNITTRPGNIERERCEQYCNTHGCQLVDVAGEFEQAPYASPRYSGDKFTHRNATVVNRWNCEWVLVTKLMASDRRALDRFGSDVAVNGYEGIVVAGAPNARVVDYLNRNSVGLERRGDVIPGAGFGPNAGGTSASTGKRSYSFNELDRDTNDDAMSGVERSGAIYVFAMEHETRSSTGVLTKGEVWNVTEHAKLQPPQKMHGDRFGAAVAIDEGHHVLAGAPRDTGMTGTQPMPGRETGLAHFYDVEFLNVRFATGAGAGAPAQDGAWGGGADEEGSIGGRGSLLRVSESVYYQGAHQYDYAQNFVEVELVRRGELAKPLTVGYATSDITAIGNSPVDADLCFSYPVDFRGMCGDYVHTKGLVTFAAGQSLVHVRVYLMDDHCPEPEEYFRVNLFVPGGDVIIGPEFSATVRIEDDDGLAQPNDHTAFQLESDGTSSNRNCKRRVPQRGFAHADQADFDLVENFLDRVVEESEDRRSIGTDVEDSRYVAVDDLGWFEDGSPRVGGGLGYSQSYGDVRHGGTRTPN